MSKEQEVRQELHAAWARNQAVIVKFETQWCGPCRMLTQFLQGQMQRFPGTLKILRVDCEASDANREYAAAHAVQSYPTLMMYANGVLVETIRGFNQQAVVDGIERIVRLVANDDCPRAVPELSEQLADEMEARLGARSPADFLEASRLLVTFLRNVAVHPEEPKYRKVNTKNPRYVKHAAMLTEALLLCGFEEDGDNLVLGGERVRDELVQTAKLLQRAMLQYCPMARQTEPARAGQAVVSAGDLSNALNSLM